MHRLFSWTLLFQLPDLKAAEAEHLETNDSRRSAAGAPGLSPTGPSQGGPACEGQSRLLGGARKSRARTRQGQGRVEGRASFPHSRWENEVEGLGAVYLEHGIQAPGTKRQEEDKAATSTQTQRALGLYANGPQPDGAQFPLRHWLGLRAFANMALRTAEGLRRNRAWPCGSSPPPCADWRQTEAGSLIGWQRSHSGRLWWVRLP